MQHYSDNIRELREYTRRDDYARAGVAVSVYQGAVLATIYSDNGVTPKANPLTTGVGGAFDFYAANGDYTITAAGLSKAVTLFDDTDYTADSLAGAPTATPNSTSTVLGETAGVVRRFAKDSLGPVVPLARYGTSADAGAALSAVETAYPDGSHVYLGNGTWTITTGFTGTGNRMKIDGGGRYASSLSFSPASPATALTFNNPGAGGYNQGGVCGVAFVSSNSTAKTAIDLVNAANFSVRDIAISSSNWPGPSIGIRTRGRQFVHVDGCEIGCARPIVISPNATYPALATDHFLIENSELVGSSASYPVIEVETGVSFSNMSLKHLALAGGKHGIYWNDTTSTAASFVLSIEEIRTEQMLDAAGYSIYLASNVQALQSLIVSKAYLSSQAHGIYLRNAQRVHLEDVSYSGGAGTVALDMTFVSGSHLTLKNFWMQTGSTMTLTNARCVSREFSASGQIRNEEWIYDGGTGEGAIQSDVYHSGVPVEVAAGATAVLTNGLFNGFLFISSSESVNGIIGCQGTTAATQELSDPSGFFGITSGSGSVYDVFHNGTNYVIKNQRAYAVTFHVYRVGFGQ